MLPPAIHFSSRNSDMFLPTNHQQPLELKHELIPSALQIFLIVNCQINFHLFEALLLLFAFVVELPGGRGWRWGGCRRRGQRRFSPWPVLDNWSGVWYVHCPLAILVFVGLRGRWKSWQVCGGYWCAPVFRSRWFERCQRRRKKISSVGGSYFKEIKEFDAHGSGSRAVIYENWETFFIIFDSTMKRQCEECGVRERFMQVGIISPSSSDHWPTKQVQHCTAWYMNERSTVRIGPHDNQQTISHIKSSQFLWDLNTGFQLPIRRVTRVFWGLSSNNPLKICTTATYDCYPNGRSAENPF